MTSFRDYYNYFSSVKSLYPGGIPVEEIRRALKEDEPVSEEQSDRMLESAPADVAQAALSKYRSAVDSEANVMAEGAAGAVLAVVGFAPGAAELEAQAPFRSPEGEMLRKALSAGMKLSPSEVYLTSLWKGLPDNIDDSEILQRSAAEIVLEELEQLAPRSILLLGEGVAQALIAGEAGAEDKNTSGRAPGQWLNLGVGKLPALLTYDLDAVYSDLQTKREFWNHLQDLIQKLNGCE